MPHLLGESFQVALLWSCLHYLHWYCFYVLYDAFLEANVVRMEVFLYFKYTQNAYRCLTVYLLHVINKSITTCVFSSSPDFYRT